jgi:hypothetical protein
MSRVLQPEAAALFDEVNSAGDALFLLMGLHSLRVAHRFSAAMG